MPTKIYLASSFANKSIVESLASQLKAKGHVITQEWWHTDFKQAIDKQDAEWYNDDRVQAISKRNFQGIVNADVLVLIANSEPRKFNGANIELGYALALGKPCFSIGVLERSAMYCPIKRLVSSDELFKELDFFSQQNKETNK